MTGMPHVHRFLETGAAPVSGLPLSLGDHAAECFRWLADLFAAPPDLNAVASYRRGAAAVWLDSLMAIPGLGSGLSQMRQVLDSDLGDAELTSSIGLSYGRLFLGIGGPNTVAPYESAQRFGGRLYQAPASEMAGLLRAHDLSISAACSEPADHLAVELALMAHLTATANPAHTALSARLRGWVPQFCELCVRQDRFGFWAGAAKVLSTVVLAYEPTETTPATPINQVF
jgi:TorA specific chaperone